MLPPLTPVLFAKAFPTHWTKWLNREDFEKKYPNMDPNYRSVLPAEVICEFDFENKKMNLDYSTTLQEKFLEHGIGFIFSFSGNKSYHTVSFFPELEKVPNQIRPRAKELIVKELTNPNLFDSIDHANFRNGRMIGIINEPHRSTGVKKTLIKVVGNPYQNKIPIQIKKKISKLKVFKPNKKISFNRGSKCLFIEWCCENKLPVSCRNQNLVPNVVAYTENRTVWKQCAMVQGKQLTEFENWAKREPEFSCAQLKKYSEKIGMGNLCALCGGM